MRRFKVTHELIRNSQLISSNEFSSVFRLPSGNYLKIFTPDTLMIYQTMMVDIEAKLQNANKLGITNDILKPCAIAYDLNNAVVGFEMQPARGINFNQFDALLTFKDRQNLYGYAEIHKKIEDILRNNPNIVVTDLCSCDNIYIDENKNISLIDYDDMQIGNQRSLMISSSLGTQRDIITTPKYFDDLTQLFTKTLDVRSSIILYFLTAFNINLNSVGLTAPGDTEPITLDFIFDALMLDDPDLCHNVWKMMQKNQTEDFLGDTVFRIADKYDLKIVSICGDKIRKQLIRK